MTISGRARLNSGAPRRRDCLSDHLFVRALRPGHLTVPLVSSVRLQPPPSDPVQDTGKQEVFIIGSSVPSHNMGIGWAPCQAYLVIPRQILTTSGVDQGSRRLPAFPPIRQGISLFRELEFPDPLPREICRNVRETWHVSELDWPDSSGDRASSL